MNSILFYCIWFCLSSKSGTMEFSVMFVMPKSFMSVNKLYLQYIWEAESSDLHSYCALVICFLVCDLPFSIPWKNKINAANIPNSLGCLIWILVLLGMVCSIFFVVDTGIKIKILSFFFRYTFLINPTSENAAWSSRWQMYWIIVADSQEQLCVMHRRGSALYKN